MNRLDGKAALISGAARSIGAETSALTVEADAKVVKGTRRTGRERARTLSDAVLYGHLDVTSEDDWNAAVADAVDSGTELVITAASSRNSCRQHKGPKSEVGNGHAGQWYLV